MILTCNFEEVTALTHGAHAFLSERVESNSRVAAPCETRGAVESLLSQLSGDLSLNTLSDQRQLYLALEAIVEYVRDSIVLPNVGRKWVNTWTPLILTFFFFILFANAVGLIPIFEVVALVDRWVLHTGADSLVKRLLHGGTTATANFNVTAALATVTFGAIILAGTRAHGFVKHWKNLVPHGLAPLLYVILIPIEVMGMFVRPFALTMRLAANMTGGHIAILAILSFVFLFAEMFGRAIAGVGVGLAVSVPLAVGISALEIIVVLVQAYVFTLLTAVFMGMAIHAHH